MLKDLRFAVGQLVRSPGFSVVGVLTVSFVVGVNATVFSLVRDSFLRPVPAKDPGQLVVKVQKSSLSDTALPFSHPDFLDFHLVEGGEADHVNPVDRSCSAAPSSSSSRPGWPAGCPPAARPRSTWWWP